MHKRLMIAAVILGLGLFSVGCAPWAATWAGVQSDRTVVGSPQLLWDDVLARYANQRATDLAANNPYSGNVLAQQYNQETGYTWRICELLVSDRTLALQTDPNYAKNVMAHSSLYISCAMEPLFDRAAIGLAYSQDGSLFYEVLWLVESSAFPASGR